MEIKVIVDTKTDYCRNTDVITITNEDIERIACERALSQYGYSTCKAEAQIDSISGLGS